MTGSEAGLTTAEHAELVAARKPIREIELAVHRRAAELLKERPGPKVASPRSK